MVNFNYMHKLFSQTSKVLRDKYIVELQNHNKFLEKKLSNINMNPFFGYHVKIKDHLVPMSQEHIPETQGVIYKIDKSSIWVMYKNLSGEKKIRCFFIEKIEFTDKRFDNFFN